MPDTAKPLSRMFPVNWGLGVDISARIKPVWEVLPKRWIGERSLVWINNSRRLSKDYEISVCFLAISRK